MSNIQPYIILNGTDSRSISGLLISSLPPISKPQVRTQIETVDGRDGDIVTPLGFSAYDKVIKIGLTYNYDVDEIIEFFNSEGIVTFSNEPDKYYRYAIYEQIDFEKLIRFKTAEVVLHVQPFKFSTTEEPELFDVVSGQAIAVTNEGNTDSRPNLTIIGSGDIDVSLNGSQILSIELENDQAVIIDSEDMNAYEAQSAIREVVVDIQAKQAGTGDPSPSNIREISGYNAANITDCGDNFLNGDKFADNFSTAAGYNKDTVNKTVSFTHSAPPYHLTVFEMPFKPNTQYTFIFNYTAVSTNRSLRIGYTDGTNGEIYFEANDTKSALVVTSASGKTINEIYLTFFADGLTTLYYDECGVFEGIKTLADFEEFSGETYNIPFEQDGEPLTVGDGSLDVSSGELTITSIAHIFNGTENFISLQSNTVFAYDFATSLINSFGQDNSLCSHFTNETSGGGWGNIGVNHYLIAGGQYFGVNPNMSLSDYKTWLSNQYANNTPVTVIATLATPLVIQLTPTQIYNLLGVNNMYSDTGDITVKHKANGVIVTNTGSIVSFSAGLDDIEKGVLLNRAITGDYDKIRLRKGVNTFVLTGNARQFVIDKFSRWI